MSVRAGLAQRLRAETRAAHDAIEAAMDFEARVADAPAYRRWLARLYGFHRVWEPAVAAALAEPALFDPRRKLALLADDLARFGEDDPATLPVPDWPAFSSPGAALGSLYVVEGSTLGGQLIARRVREVLGVAPAYHASYGRDAGRMWRAFGERLAAVPEADHDAVVAGADDTFVRLRGWLAA